MVSQCIYNLQTLLWVTKHNLAVRGESIHVLILPTINPHDNINKSRIWLQVKLKRQIESVVSSPVYDFIHQIYEPTEKKEQFESDNSV